MSSNFTESIVRHKGIPEKQVELLDTQTFFELLKLPYPMDRAGVIDRLPKTQIHFRSNN